jgi:hypothetical protein
MEEIVNSKECLLLKQKANKLKSLANATHDPARREFDLGEARLLEEEAEASLTPLEPLKTALGGEILPPQSFGMIGLENALKEPDMLDCEVSVERTQLADKAGVFEMAIQTAEDAKAKGSIQKMLTHQMAAAHKHCMRLIAESNDQRDPMIKAKLTNTAVRLMDAYAKGALTLQKLQTGASQIVTVQHVSINGGQAVIGNVG